MGWIVVPLLALGVGFARAAFRKRRRVSPRAYAVQLNQDPRLLEQLRRSNHRENA